jgi:hypothetical protein
MMSIPFVDRATGRRNRGRPNPRGLDRCLICDLPTESRLFVHLGEGGSMILAPGERSKNGQDEDGEGGQGFFPIGPDCARRLPSEYVVESKS